MLKLDTRVSKFFSQYLCILCASFMLIGCSYFDTGEASQLEAGKAVQKIDLMRGDYAAGAPSLSEVAARSTSGSVQIFDVGNEAPLMATTVEAPMRASDLDAQEVQEIAAVPPQDLSLAMQQSPPSNVGIFSADPRVQIFPLDGGMIPQAPVVVQSGSLMPSPAPFVSREAVVNSSAATVYFGHDSTSLDAPTRSQVRDWAKRYLMRPRQDVITVSGHASSRATGGDVARRSLINLNVSLKRAYAVTAELVKAGIPAELIRSVGWGDTRPAGLRDGKTPEQAARRVEISLQGQTL